MKQLMVLLTSILLIIFFLGIQFSVGVFFVALFYQSEAQPALLESFINTHTLMIVIVSTLERHLYLFVGDQAQARALIAVDAPDSEGVLSFKDTANEALREGFLPIYDQ